MILIMQLTMHKQISQLQEIDQIVVNPLLGLELVGSQLDLSLNQ